jgi:hypothetical protein
MRRVISLVKPKNGFAHVAHSLLTALTPLLVYAFVRWQVAAGALAVILLSKWRVLAVRPRHWWPNIRANGVDLIVGLSILAFMIQTPDALWQFMLAVAYGGWLLLIKPRSDTFSVSLQALVAQVMGVTALMAVWSDQPTAVLVVSASAICYISARHFFSGFEEPRAPLFAHSWGYFGAALSWILSHWLLFYGPIAQPAVLLAVIGFGLGALYYLEQVDRLPAYARRQLIFLTVAAVAVVLVLTDWGNRV